MINLQDINNWKEEIKQQQKEEGEEICQIIEGNELLEIIKLIEDLKSDRDYYKEMYYKIAFPEEEIRIKGLGVD